MSTYSQYLKEAFLRYTAISSQSNSKVKSLPSTDGQVTMIHQIKGDLTALGVTDIRITPSQSLIAKIPGNAYAPPLAFLAHVDTVDIGASPEVHAQLIDYKGGDVTLNTQKNIIFRSGERPEIAPYLGQEIFFTDGTSVLGADDKAGVSVLTALAKFLSTENIKHGDVFLAYLPDEEIGLKGAYALKLADLPAELCYTIDGGEIGKFGCETFNAAGADIIFEGVSIHPGSAKDVMVNPIFMVQHFISQFNFLDTPEHSSNKEGYFWMHDLHANPMRSTLEMSIRDFDKESFAKRKVFVEQCIKATQKAFPKGNITYTLKDDYSNIASAMGSDLRCIHLAHEAYKAAGVPLIEEAVRGGTDGSVLSAKGMPTPNIFTGGLNCHSIFEFLPLPSLVKSFDVCTQIISLAPKYLKK